MSTPSEQPSSESTYFIHDSAAELVRVIELERVLTRSLGGILPEHPDLSTFLAPFHRVLDVACGPGGWALELAQAYPHLEVMGFDIDPRMINYATTQAQVGRLDNASFKVMNAAGPLDYPDNYFDLVNARYLAVVPIKIWPEVMQEIFRITRPGGIIRLTENEEYSITTGLTPLLGRFLRNAGCQNIQRKPFVIDWSAGMEAHDAVFQVLSVFMRLVQPFLIQMGVTTQEEADRLYREAEIEMLSDDFCALWYFLTVWGEKPGS